MFAIDKTIIRELFINNILYDPITVIFRGQELQARKNETSFERKITYSAMAEKVSFELMIALPVDSPVPKIGRAGDNISISEKVYAVHSVNPHFDGTDCYDLTLQEKK